MTITTTRPTLTIIEGDLCDAREKLIVEAGDRFGFLYCTETPDLVPFEHGWLDPVIERAVRLCEGFQELGLDTILRCYALPVDAEIIGEINACVDDSRRFDRFDAFLADLRHRRPDVAWKRINLTARSRTNDTAMAR